MASILKHGSGWQAQVAKSGVRRSKKFATKSEARAWANRQEYLIASGEGVAAPGTVSDLLLKYAKEVSPTKRGERWEVVRIKAMARDALGSVSLRDLSAADVAAWRDRRLAHVSPGSVIREMILLSSVFNRARREWGLIPSNPASDVSRPKAPKPRDRRVSAQELDALWEAARTPKEVAAIDAFAFAVETAMRAGEIVRLRRSDISGRVALLRETKNGAPREVPLSTAALAMLEGRPDDLFSISSGSLDVMFRKVRDRAGIVGLTFHDSRHEAITRLSKRLHVLALARVVGHKDIRMLSVYYNESAEDLAGLLG